MVSVDVYRPAAREQLKVVAREVGQPDLRRRARRDACRSNWRARRARGSGQTGRDVLLVDTAGRLHIDEELMTELQQLKSSSIPVEILFVADAMTGQDAVKSADEFHKRLGITGVILTKMDGDARGGAALSIRHVTGQPLKFVGVGEKPDALEPFHPDRAANRILGMGDILSLHREGRARPSTRRKPSRCSASSSRTSSRWRISAISCKQIRKLGPLRIAAGHDAARSACSKN